MSNKPIESESTAKQPQKSARVRVLKPVTIGDFRFGPGHEMDLPVGEAEFREKREEVVILNLI